MRVAIALASLVAAATAAVLAAALPTQAQEFDFTGQGTVRANGPGLTCRETTHPTFGYAAPSFSAPRVVRFSLVVAVTGPAVDDFFPVALRTGQAWVPAADTKRPTRLQSCFVRRLRDGRLLYSSHDRIQSD